MSPRGYSPKRVPKECPVCGGPAGTGHSGSPAVDLICWTCWSSIPLQTVELWHNDEGITTASLIAIARERRQSCKTIKRSSGALKAKSGRVR